MLAWSSLLLMPCNKALLGGNHATLCTLFEEL